MKVAELIAELQKLDPELPVYFDHLYLDVPEEVRVVQIKDAIFKQPLSSHNAPKRVELS